MEDSTLMITVTATRGFSPAAVLTVAAELCGVTQRAIAGAHGAVQLRFSPARTELLREKAGTGRISLECFDGTGDTAIGGVPLDLRAMTRASARGQQSDPSWYPLVKCSIDPPPQLQISHSFGPASAAPPEPEPEAAAADEGAAAADEGAATATPPAAPAGEEEVYVAQIGEGTADYVLSVSVSGEGDEAVDASAFALSWVGQRIAPVAVAGGALAEQRIRSSEGELRAFMASPPPLQLLSLGGAGDEPADIDLRSLPELAAADGMPWSAATFAYFSSGSVLVQLSLGEVTNAPDMYAVPAEPHQYRISVEMRSIRGVDSAGRTFLRYAYPLFGGGARPFRTQLLSLRSREETLLNQSYCGHDLFSQPSALEAGLRARPLAIELWNRDKFKADTRLGVAIVPMCALTTAGVDGYVQIQSGSDGSAIGELRVIAGLTDMGAAGSDAAVRLQASLPAASNQVASVVVSESMESLGNSSTVSRGDPEYEVAWQLEQWKKKEEARWKIDIAAREALRMDALEAAWRQRELEREEAVSKAIAAHRHAEQQLRRAVLECESKEQALQLREELLPKQIQEMQRKCTVEVTRMEDTCRRVREEHVHQSNLQAVKLKDSEVENKRLRERGSVLEEGYRAKEAEHVQFVQIAKGTPEMQLRDELMSMASRLAEVESRLREAVDGKVYYKELLVRSLREVNHLRQSRAQDNEDSLKQKHRDVDELRLRYLAKSESKQMTSDRDALDAIKQQLGSLGSGAAVAAAPAATSGSAEELTANSLRLVGASDELKRLLSERDALLGSGVYTAQDGLIRTLQAKIENLSS